MCQCKLWEFSVFFACFCVYAVTTFNVDSLNYAAYSGLDTSMFGFSMALHKEGNNGWLIVGAPEAQSAYQRGVIRGGVVYKCPTNGDERCQEIPFDTKDNIMDQTTGLLLDNKTEQWFGATVSSSGREEGSIVACAPRYTWYPRKRSRRDPVGTCYVSNALFNEFNEYSPCRTYQWGYHRQGSCQAGFSAAINSIADRLFVGAPGSWYWQGQMYSVDAHAKFEYKPLLFSDTYGAEGQVHQLSLETRPAVFSTVEGTEKDDDSYMGYSTIVGDFLGNGDPREECIAVGMPRGNNLKGVVLLFTWNLTDFRHFTSDQLGSYFGYTLAASDVDGDGKVDLIIGSPMYTVPNNKNKFDVGRVYVFYHKNNTVPGTFMTNDTIDGFNSRSRFGQALASLGDINQDGYGDFAVGAPYDGPGNRGAVYIYHGSSTGVRDKYSQVIFAEDIDTFSLSTFGFSITGGLDLDGNEYPDMAIGAYLSNRAFFFRSRPVIRVDAWVQFLTKNKEINITEANYILKSARNVKVFRTEIEFCARYYGKGIPDTINLNLQYILDSKKMLNPRMGFVDDEGQNVKNDSIKLYLNRTRCSTETKRIEVYVRSDIRDKLTALVAEVKYWMKTDQPYYEHVRNPRSPLAPVLDLNSPPSKKDSIRISKNCGVCIPNLSLNVTPSVDQYMLNSEQRFNLTVTVSNTGDDSFESTIEVHYSEGLDYGASEDINVVSHVLCTSVGNRTVQCDIGNPIPRDKTVIFQLWWKPVYDLKVTPSSYEFSVEVNSTNPEDDANLANNKQNISVGILYDYHQELNGRSIPAEMFYNFTYYNVDITNQTHLTPPRNRLSEEVIGPWVIHLYYLTNEGKTTIEETELFFAWPAYTLSEVPEDFLYLLEPPEFSITEDLNIQCGPIPANYRDFEVILNNKTIWERYHLNVGRDGGASQQVGTTPIPPFGPPSGSDKVGAVVGGGTAKGNKNIDIAVDTAQDISQISGARNKSGGSFAWANQTHYWNNQTHYRNGSGIYLISTGQWVDQDTSGTWSQWRNQTHYLNKTGMYLIGTGEWVDGSGTWSGSHWRNQTHYMNGTGIYLIGTGQRIDVGGQGTVNIPVRTKQTTTKVEIFQRQSGGQNWGHRVGNTDYYYRCTRIDGGEEVEVDCGPNFTMANITRLLQQQGTTVQSECTRTINGVREVVDCATLFPNGVIPSARIETKQNIRYRCFIVKDGEYTEMDCGSSNLLFSDARTRPRCLQSIDGRRETDIACDEVVRIHQSQGYSSGGAQSQHLSGSAQYGHQGGSATPEDRGYQNNRQGGSGSQYNQQGQYGYNQNYGDTSQWQNGYTTSNLSLYDYNGNHYGYDGAGSSHYSAANSGDAYRGTAHETNRFEDDYNRQAPRRDPKTYGTYGGTRNQVNSQNSGLGNAALGGSFQTGVLGLNTIDQGENYSESEPIGRDNVPTDRPSPNRGWHGRKKRQAQAVDSHPSIAEIRQQYPCNSIKCIYMRCTVQNLRHGKRLAIALRGRLNGRVLTKMGFQDSMTFSTLMVARVRKLPHQQNPVDQKPVSHEIVTTIKKMGEAELKSDIVPLWVVVLSAVAGTIILLLLVFLLYKLGFFKRNRPSGAPERQPLNKNGYHHGDEVL